VDQADLHFASARGQVFFEREEGLPKRSFFGIARCRSALARRPYQSYSARAPLPHRAKRHDNNTVVNAPLERI
jgi:hypothetical protein